MTGRRGILRERPAAVALLLIGALVAFRTVAAIGDSPSDCGPFTLFDALFGLSALTGIGWFAFEAGKEYGRIEPPE